MRKSLLSDYSTNFGNLVSRRNSEHALRAAALEAEMANRAKSEFLANMSHELRTPLNAIIGFSDLIKHLSRNDQASDKTLEYAAHISGAGKHLLAIISDILDLSKVENKSLKLNIEESSIEQTVRDCAALIEGRIGQKSQRLALRIAGGIEPFPFDTLRVKQIVLNLLTNGSKFTPEGGQITVAVTSEPNSVLIAVIDTGIGMAPDQIEHALKPFGQIKSAFTRDHEGTGLGLSIAKALVEEHGGRFHISSQPNVGTEVCFSLPRCMATSKTQFSFEQIGRSDEDT